MESDQELSLHSYYVDDKIDESAAEIGFEFTEKLTIAADLEADDTESEYEDNDDDDDDDEEEDEEFSFASVSDDALPIAADKVFQDGQIRPIFPLFNQNLLLGDDVAINRFPIVPSVDKVFIESMPNRPSVSDENEEIEGIAAGPYCTWTKGASPEFDKKSNSTGFSRLWRFKEKMNRSHSDGRDAFVYLNNSTTPSSSSRKEEKSVVKVDKSVVKKSTDGGEKIASTGEKVKSKKGGKRKVTTSLSPHEVYLRSKLTEEERRRSYLPYRPELMGFFTNVHGGGLTRNVHPF